MKRKINKENRECFVNGHCCYDCPNFQVDLFEDKYDLPASEIGLERVKCSDCHYQTYDCKDCYFENTDNCRRCNNGNT